MTHVGDGYVTVRDIDWSGQKAPTNREVQEAAYLQGAGLHTHVRIRSQPIPPPSYVMVGRRRLPFFNRDSKFDVATWRVGQQLARREVEHGRIDDFTARWDGGAVSPPSESVRIVFFTGGILDFAKLYESFPNVADVRALPTSVRLRNTLGLVGRDLRAISATADGGSEVDGFVSESAPPLQEIRIGGLIRATASAIDRRWSQVPGVFCDVRYRDTRKGGELPRYLRSWIDRDIPQGAFEEVLETLVELATGVDDGADLEPLLRRAVCKLNAIEDSHGFIDSMERDELMSEILSIVESRGGSVISDWAFELIEGEKSW